MQKRFFDWCLMTVVSLLLSSVMALAQNGPITVSGLVTSAVDGEPMAGVTVQVKGTANGTTTDVEGRYSIRTEQGQTLSFSFIGFERQEQRVAGTRLDVVLAEDRESLDEVVVIGYGSVRKKDLTGSVTQITSQQLQKASVSNVLSSLEGRVPGLSITPESGSPGASADVLIHGKQSINGTNTPIYVIDGTISDGLNISPNDVETISVLKDASAVAIYGARAANGVIVVTTKRGNTGAPTITFKTEHSLQQEGNLRMHFLNAAQWVEIAGEAYENAGKNIPWSDADVAALSGNDVCWPDYMKQNSYLTTNNLSVRGGNDKSKYFISLNQTYNDGIVKGEHYNRLNLRINGDHKINRWITFGHSISMYSSKKSNKTDKDNRNLYNTSFRYAPLNAAYDENGEYATIYNTSLQSKTPSPVFLLDNMTNDTTWKGAEGNIYLSLDLFDGLKFTTRASAKWENSRQTIMQGAVDSKYGFEGSSTNQLIKRSNDSLHWIVDYLLDYHKQLGSHSISALLGYSAEKSEYEKLNASRGNTPSNSIHYLDAGDPSTALNGNSYTEWAFLSQFGRVAYSFMDRYYLNFTIRRDGTSRLSGNRYGVFPSVSAAWRLGEERFMDGVEWLDELKIRASIGEVGNVQSISEYGTALYLSSQNAVFNEKVTSGYSSITAVNTDLKWESTTKKDIGFDLNVLKNKLYFVGDFYVEDTHDLLFTQPIPYSTGLSGSPYINAGHVRNIGFDFEAGYRQTFGDWRVDAAFNLSHVTNEVIDLEGRDLRTSGVAEGYPIGSWFGYISDGLNRTEQDLTAYPQFEGKKVGDIRFKDVNGDGKVDADDRDLFGKVFPDFTYGLVMSVAWHNLTLQTQINGVQGLEKYMLNGTFATDMFNNEPNMEADYVLDRFHPTKNPNGKYPRVAMGDPGKNQQRNDFWLIDASYLSIRNISLSYSVPQAFLGHLRMSAMNIYLGVQNLYTHGDPYSIANSTVSVPIPRVFTAGLEITF